VFISSRLAASTITRRSYTDRDLGLLSGRGKRNRLNSYSNPSRCIFSSTACRMNCDRLESDRTMASTSNGSITLIWC